MAKENLIDKLHEAQKLGDWDFSPTIPATCIP
jgi:hypothetical protein